MRRATLMARRTTWRTTKGWRWTATQRRLSGISTRRPCLVTGPPQTCRPAAPCLSSLTPTLRVHLEVSAAPLAWAVQGLRAKARSRLSAAQQQVYGLHWVPGGKKKKKKLIYFSWFWGSGKRRRVTDESVLQLPLEFGWEVLLILQETSVLFLTVCLAASGV